MGSFNNCKPDFSIIFIRPFYTIYLEFGPDNIGMSPKTGTEAYPSSGIDTEGNYNLPFGHAGIVLVEGGTGLTKYYEYGRYFKDSNDKHIGGVRNRSVPNLSLNSNGWPTVASLHNLAKSITHSAGKDTYMQGNFDHTCGGFDKAIAFAESYNNPNYNFYSNNCMTFAHKVNAARGALGSDQFLFLDSFPPFERDIAIWQNSISYSPGSNNLKVWVWQISE